MIIPVVIKRCKYNHFLVLEVGFGFKGGSLTLPVLLLPC